MSSRREPKYVEEGDLRRGPWTLEEDTLLIHYIACHGEGRWNLLAMSSGLKRTGKSCRLRWLNYLKPDVKRGNLSPEEQILILELHAKWGNRWSRIAQNLPGRTDNEIKNYWRTRVQKQARKLMIDANSTMFRDAVRCYWIPRLLQKIEPPTIESLDPDTTTPLSEAIQELGTDQFPNSSTQSQFRSFSCYEQLYSSGDCSSSIIPLDSMELAQVPKVSEFSSSSIDELGSNPFNPFLNTTGLSPRTELDASDRASASSSGLGYSVSAEDCSMLVNNYIENNAEKLWSMDDLWQIRKLHGWEI